MQLLVGTVLILLCRQCEAAAFFPVKQFGRSKRLPLQSSGRDPIVQDTVKELPFYAAPKVTQHTNGKDVPEGPVEPTDRWDVNDDAKAVYIGSSSFV